MTVLSLLMAAAGPSITPYLVGSSFAGSFAGPSVTVNKPAGVQVGDLLISVCQSSSAITWTGDTGWTQAGIGGTPALRIAYKLASSSEPSSYTFTGSSSVPVNCHLLAFRRGEFDAIGTFATSGTPTVAPTVSASVKTSLLLACFASQDASITPTTPSGMTKIALDDNSFGSSSAVFSQSVDAGSTGSRSSTLGASTHVAGVLLVIKPA